MLLIWNSTLLKCVCCVREENKFAGQGDYSDGRDTFSSSYIKIVRNIDKETEVQIYRQSSQN